MRTRAAVELAVVLILVAACVPPPLPSTLPAAPTAGAAVTAATPVTGMAAATAPATLTATAPTAGPAGTAATPVTGMAAASAPVTLTATAPTAGPAGTAATPVTGMAAANPLATPAGTATTPVAGTGAATAPETPTPAVIAPQAVATGQANLAAGPTHAAAGGVPADWQTYDNSEAGFSIRYPPNWSQTQMTQAETGLASGAGVALEGSEGRVELTWGMGFGGACNAYSAIHAAQGQLSTCYSVAPDGTRNWNQIYKILPTTGFGARAFTKDANQDSADLVLAVLATLTFGSAPAGQGTPAPTPAPAQGMEIVIDNNGASFWPRGNWYVVSSNQHTTAQIYGEDCYKAYPGLDASAEVRPDLPAGAYEVFARWCGDPGTTNQSTHGVIEVHRSAGDAAPQPAGVNYQANVGQWQSLGTYNLQPDAFLRVKSVLDGAVIADAFRFVYRSEAAPEAAPTPLPSGTIVSGNPPSPLQQVTSGDLVARLALVDPFYVSVPMTPTQQTFDDCQAFPREGCGGTRAGWQAMVTYQQPISLTYRVSSDYKLVGVEGADSISPWFVGQDQPQLVFLRGSGGGSNYGVYYYPDNTWHVLRPAAGSAPASDATLTADQGATLKALADKYSTLYLQTAGGGTLVFYGLGPTVAPSAADKETLLALGAALSAVP